MTPRSRNILAVIIACALLLSAGAAAYIYHDNRSEETTSPHDVTITDSLGNQVTVTAPVTSICTVNTNAAEFFEVLGVEDRVVSADSATISSLSEIYGNVLDVGSYKTPSGEKIAESGAAIVVSQSSARSLSSATEQALKDNYGITVLRLDCYGETMLNDVEQLVKIMDSDSAENAYDGYVSTYDSVKDQVLKLSESCSGDPSYLMYFTSMGRYYNENSELGKIVSSIHGHNALADMNVDSGKAVTSSPDPGAILDCDKNTGIDYIFIRAGSSGLEASYESFVQSGGSIDYNQLSAVTEGHVFVIDSDVLSGPRDYVGYVCLAEAFGIDTGFDALKLVNEFNDKYGFSEDYTELVKNIGAQ